MFASASQLESYCYDAMSTRKSFADVKDWARSYARNYYHSVDNQIGFLPVYHALLSTDAKLNEKIPLTCAERVSATPPAPVVKAKAKKVDSAITPEFLSFLEKVKSNRKDFADVKEWARANARTYFHEVSEEPGFLPIYNALLSFNNEAKDIPPFSTREEVISKKATLTVGEKRYMDAIKANKATPLTSSSKIRVMTIAEIYAESSSDIKHFDSVESWARATARNYFHQLGGKTKFLDIYLPLLDLAYDDLENGSDFDSDSSCEDHDDASSATEEEDDADDSTYMTESSEESEDESLADDEENEMDDDSCCEEYDAGQLVKDGAQTSAEIALGRKIVNKVLYKEYNEWYSAFEEEEDGENGFVWHCAKILSKKYEMPAEDCALIVQAWLIMKQEKEGLSPREKDAIDILTQMRKM